MAAEGRERLLDYVRQQIMGPPGAEVESLRDPPHRRYLLGVLYPRGSVTDEILQAEEQEEAGSVKDELADDPVRLANEWMPQSVGVSFLTKESGAIEVDVWAARYATGRDGRATVWTRVVIASPEQPETIRIDPPQADRVEGARPAVLDGRASLYSYWRRVGAGHLVTIALVNEQRQPQGKPEADLCLHQVGLRCRPVNGTVVEYPSVERLSREPDEEELRLVHRHARVFAIGHGCAAAWEDGAPDQVDWVEAEFLPVYEVPSLTPDVAEDDDCLSLSFLADGDRVDHERMFAALDGFVGRYGDWIELQSERNEDIAVHLHAARERLLDRARRAVGRMRKGIRTLRDDETVRRGFRLGQLAMLVQMSRAKQEIAGTRRPRGQGAVHDIDYTAQDDVRWRPFQLAYQLLVLESLAYPTSTDRSDVDLLWFPTGGGKTEAYLAVAATELILRRLRWGERGGGTGVITRYTLRLLTAQQFQRASAMVCALEYLRRDRTEELGTEPFRAGLWVGQDATPNTFGQAVDRLAEVLADLDPPNPWQIEKCSWCGTEIIPSRREADRSAYGVEATPTSFRLFCPTETCIFHIGIPASMVDQDLYAHPPSFLIATVDKFAQLAWSENGGAFFGGDRAEPPSLVIQDELHLLTGPLGTTVGLYESAIEAVISMKGSPPKVVASTATIRRAEDQALGLFARPVDVFPPSGLDARDSYFARVDEESPGRLYVGVLSPSHTAPMAFATITGALLQGVVEVGLTGDELDAYWTLVAYHNTLRDLGKTMTLARDDVPARMRAFARDHSSLRTIEGSVVELTSNVPGKELPSILSRMFLRHDAADSISMLASTNMLSVGVDVQRLGLMLVNGQPKSTSEYIQATSRVGRGVPGLIITVLRSTQPRDRSHYESFRPYHAALHRYVEPSSVTPFSLPSRDRSLHAALVILVRHGLGLSADEDAARFDADSDDARTVAAALMERVRSVDPDEVAATEAHLEQLMREWSDLADACRAQRTQLRYRSPSRAHKALLRDFGDTGGLWPTLQSMRSVDRQSPIEVMGEHR